MLWMCLCWRPLYIRGPFGNPEMSNTPPHPVFHNVKPPQLHPVVHHCWRSSQFQAVFSFFHSDSWAFLQVNIRHGEARDIFPSQFLSTNVSTHASFIYRIFSVYLGILCICWFYWNWPKISFCKKKKKKGERNTSTIISSCSQLYFLNLHRQPWQSNSALLLSPYLKLR